MLIKPFHAVFKELIKHFERLAYSKKRTRKAMRSVLTSNACMLMKSRHWLPHRRRNESSALNMWINETFLAYSDSRSSWPMMSDADISALTVLWICGRNFQTFVEHFLYIHPKSLLLKTNVNLLGLPFTKYFSSRLVVVVHLKQLVD